MSDQLSPQCQIQPFPEAVLLLLVRVDVIHGVVGQLHEFPDVLYDGHGSLLQALLENGPSVLAKGTSCHRYRLQQQVVPLAIDDLVEGNWHRVVVPTGSNVSP